MTRSGNLVLVAATGSRYRCGPLMTAMWIVLRRHDWCRDAAAVTLAEAWRTDSGRIRPYLDACVVSLVAADLIDLST
ncbi:hypothetical protein [Kutzneria sp. NPDC052558]|uniref:hypothetical protein n=1 Tax=Kutzneria sp. NPDC052558 TaxID=3364121 RepID=UPI0037C79056